ncbi:exo-beta-1,3-glucanase [Porticoccaceae bacterium]|nr:exo-beta-1,3-glucanase [Porticoccaceae bacterium]
MSTSLKAIVLCLSLSLLVACDAADRGADEHLQSPTAAEILGNPDYPAFSYGGYRGKSRDLAPTHEQLTEDLKILSAMGIKVLRTYNTSQYPQVERLLAAIKALKDQDPEFEMYLMIGTWIEAHNAWDRDGRTDHHRGNIDNNTSEVDTAVAMANQYPDIVKAIAVGNEAMVQWAVNYFVYPKTVLKWVNHLQALKASGELNPDIWITSSDNYESWGGGAKFYQTEDLAALIKAVDFLSVHTYPFHDSFYNQDFWGVLADEEQLSKQEMTAAAMARAVDYAASQYQGVADYVESLGLDKPIHIGETGWASSDSAAYGAKGSKAADEYKAKLFYNYMRDWTDRAGMSLFYFEAFDEQWKDSGDAWGSENHFGLIRLNNEVKYALWDILDQGGFDGLTRDGRPLVKSYGGDQAKLLADVLNPPFKSRMAIRKTTTVNPAAVPGEAVTADRYIVVHESMQPSDSNNMTYPSAVLKLIPWEGTVSIEMSQQGVVSITTRTSDWWGTSLEFQAEVGENLENFKSGYLHFEIRGDADVSFNIGFQTGRYLDGDQINSFAAFGPGTANQVTDHWTSYKLSIDELNAGTDLKDLTGILSLLSQNPGENKQISLKNIYYSRD